MEHVRCGCAYQRRLSLNNVMMKDLLLRNLLTVAFLLLLPLSAKATAQTGDIIYINGEK